MSRPWSSSETVSPGHKGAEVAEVRVSLARGRQTWTQSRRRYGWRCDGELCRSSGVVTPPVQNFPANAAGGVVVPNGHAEVAPPGIQGPAFLKMETPRPVESGVAGAERDTTWASILLDKYFCDGESNSVWMPVPGEKDAWRPPQPSSASHHQGRGDRNRAQVSRQAAKLARQAARACSAADLAPTPPDAIPRDAKRQSSSLDYPRGDSMPPECPDPRSGGQYAVNPGGTVRQE